MKRFRGLSPNLSLLLLALLPGSSRARAESEHLACKVSADCVVVTDSCGGSKAVNKKFENEFKKAGGCDRIGFNTENLPIYIMSALCKKGRCELKRSKNPLLETTPPPPPPGPLPTSKSSALSPQSAKALDNLADEFSESSAPRPSGLPQSTAPSER